MTLGSRKLKRNLGGTAPAVESFFGDPRLTEARVNIVLAERIFLDLLRAEVTRFAAPANEPELSRFFRHFFDPVAGEGERERFVANFQSAPPTVVLGYPRATATFPCFAVILESEEEEQNVLDDYLGETLDGEDQREAVEYVGAIFRQTYGVYIYAQHPDVLTYLYQFAKLVLFGAKSYLIQAGLIEPHFSGGELSPEEIYLPDNMFARVLRITANAVVSVPKLLDPDPARVRLGGLFMDDIVVDGIRGGVHPITDPEGD